MSLANVNVIDAMGVEGNSKRVILVIRNDEPWTGSPQQLYQLQEKLNAYLSFALDGEMAETNPELANLPLGLRIESTHPPDPRTMHLLGHVRKQVEFQDITLEVRVAPGDGNNNSGGGCGEGCGCHH